jgi:hypothetical protein
VPIHDWPRVVRGFFFDRGCHQTQKKVLGGHPSSPAAPMPSPDTAERPFLDAKLMKLVNKYLSSQAESERID